MIKKKKTRVLITGSRILKKSELIEKLIKKLRKKFNSNLEIVSLGSKDGIDKDVRDLCLLYDIDYKEVIPYYKKWNRFCIDAPYMYSKEYASRFYWMQLYKAVEYVDYGILLVHPTDTYSKNICKYFIKMNKKFILSEEF